MVAEMEFLGMNFTCVLSSLQQFEAPPVNDCLVPLVSKILGYVIVAGASIVKLPQIILIVKNKSIKGLSVTSFEMEVLGFTIALAYCLWKRLPFSAYGELVFLLLQGIFLVMLLYFYSPKLGIWTWFKAALYCGLTPQLLVGNVNEMLFEILYAAQFVMLILARVPQMYENFNTKSTGQLSFLTNFMSFGGGAVRLLTLLQAGAPGLMLLGGFLAFLANGIVVSQIVYYTKKSQTKSKTS